jgi:uncharacterized protein (DUF362 family)
MDPSQSTPPDNSNKKHLESKLSRREFVTRVGLGVGLTGLAAGGFSLLSQTSLANPQASVQLPHTVYHPRGLHKDIVLIHGTQIRMMLERGFQALGGGEKIIPKNSTVLLKPNVGFERPPELAVTTNPDVMASLTQLCFAFGAKRVIITDNPVNNASACFRRSQIKERVEAVGGEVIVPVSSHFVRGMVPEEYLFRNVDILAQPYLEADVVINVPIIKDHSLSQVSLALKGWMGLMGEGRQHLHRNMQQAIAEMGDCFPATLTIEDGMRILMSNGPTGGSLSDVKQQNVLIMSRDPVAADALATTLMDRQPVSIPYFQLAQEAHVGRMDYRSLRMEEIHV